MPSRAGRFGGGALSRRGAFTLLELLLSLSLIIILAMVGWISFSGWQDDAAFEEGVSRFESALRLARTESANLGLRLRLSFDANGESRVQYEPKPLEAPGEFVEFAACTWNDVLSGGLARVSRCELTGSSAYAPASQLSSGTIPGDANSAECLTFYPDGTSDSAVVELAPAGESDLRRAVLSLGGLDGAISTKLTDVDSLADTYEQIRLEEYPDANDNG
jgi:type II secretory pathway pseudopilin PulG